MLKTELTHFDKPSAMLAVFETGTNAGFSFSLEQQAQPFLLAFRPVPQLVGKLGLSSPHPGPPDRAYQCKGRDRMGQTRGSQLSSSQA